MGDYIHNPNYVPPNEKIRKTMTDIMRHIVAHDKYHGIMMCPAFHTLKIELECHCGKKWEMSAYDVSRSDMEMEGLHRYIEYLNSPDFFEKLKKMQADGAKEKNRKEKLLEDTGNPTISFLDL